MISYLLKKMNQNNLLFKLKEIHMQIFPKNQYTQNSDEEPVESPEEKPVRLSPEEIMKMENFLADHPEVEEKFKRYNLKTIVKEEVLKTLKK